MSDGTVTVRQHGREAEVDAPSLGTDNVDVDLDADRVEVPARMDVSFAEANDDETADDEDDDARTDGGAVEQDRVRLRGSALSQEHVPFLLFFAPLAAVAGVWALANDGGVAAALAATGLGAYLTWFAWRDYIVRRATGREVFVDE
ncbi:hypothetical protein [Halobaculum sp. EA56]|uniref:hypothetical protein n=1 Tax=Halobaculum sp. EA56 TaxID=3421648 RepID=UPI003EBA5121